MVKPPTAAAATGKGGKKGSKGGSGGGAQGGGQGGEREAVVAAKGEKLKAEMAQVIWIFLGGYILCVV